MTVTGVSWFVSEPVLKSISYWIPLPEEVNKAELAYRIDSILAGETWDVKITLRNYTIDHIVQAEVRDEVFELSIRNNGVYMRIQPGLPPYAIYQELLGIEWEQAGCYIAERVAYEYVESADC